MENTATNRHTRLYNIICAWQHFAGKPLRVTDAADVMTAEDLTIAENCLRRLANRFVKEDKQEWPELHKLAEQIHETLGD